MVSTLHRCSYDNSTISSVIKLKTILRFSPFFPPFTQRVVLLNFLDTKVNPNNLLFSQREREWLKWWSDGAMVLGKLSVPLIWIIVGQGPIALAVGADGVVWTFFPRLSFLFSFSLWKTVRYRLKYCLKGPFNPKQLTNQIQS